jgi:hypothetical protein
MREVQVSLSGTGNMKHGVSLEDPTAPYSLVEHRHFRTYCFHLQGRRVGQASRQQVRSTSLFLGKPNLYSELLGFWTLCLFHVRILPRLVS